MTDTAALPELTKQQKAQHRAQKRRAEKLETEFLECRLLRHSWAPIRPDRSPPFGKMLMLQCQRCTTIREDIVSATFGELLLRNYRYPDGYLVKSPDDGSRAFTAPALRAEHLRRMTKEIVSFVEQRPLM